MLFDFFIYFLLFHFVTFCSLLFALLQYIHKVDIKNNHSEPTAYIHLSFCVLFSPMRHLCQSEDTWGVQTKKTVSASDPENRGHTSFTYFPQCKETRLRRCCTQKYINFSVTVEAFSAIRVQCVGSDVFIVL